MANQTLGLQFFFVFRGKKYLADSSVLQRWLKEIGALCGLDSHVRSTLNLMQLHEKMKPCELRIQWTHVLTKGELGTKWCNSELVVLNGISVSPTSNHRQVIFCFKLHYVWLVAEWNLFDCDAEGLLHYDANSMDHSSQWDQADPCEGCCCHQWKTCYGNPVSCMCVLHFSLA